MRIDLHEIINIPGGEKPFRFDLDLTGMMSGSITDILGQAEVAGKVFNEAGVLTVTGRLDADVSCECARCLKEFSKHIGLDVTAYLAEQLQDGESEDTYLLEGDWADLGEIMTTAFVLNTEQRFLCSEDCKGLCSKCGKDLNEGPCDCREDQDPRLAVLGQLLENKD